MKHLRLWCLMLVVVMLLGCFAACTPADQPDPEDPKDSDVTDPSDDPNQEDPNQDDPQEDEMDKYVKLSEKGQKLYDATYQTMLDRLHENGYAQTSLTGAYQGMFIRDASIQAMAHIAQGDMEEAMSILRFMSSYHQATDAKFAYHIMDEFKQSGTWDYLEADEQPASVASGATASNEDFSIPLYKINMPTNGCAQQVVVPFDNISEMSFYLELAGKDGQIVVSVGTAQGDDSLGRATSNIADLGSGKGWFNIKFDTPVKVEAGKEYVISLWAENASGNIVSFGKTSGGTGFNYDVPSFGGWRKNGQVIAYRILSNTSFVGSENAITQTFVAKGDVVNTAVVEIVCAQKTKLHAAIVDATGKQLATAETETEGGTVCFDFGSVAIKEGDTYGLSLYADAGDVTWNGAPMPTVAYRTGDADHKALNETYTLQIFPEYSGTRTAAFAKIGGDVVAEQTLSSTLNKQFVTWAQLYLAANGTPAADDTFTVSLYKGIELISSVTRPVSSLSQVATAYNFEFALPMSELSTSESYTIEVSATKAESVCWFGTAKKDASQKAKLGDAEQDMVYSYRAGTSSVKPLSTKIQVDGNYMWVNAFAMFALEGDEKYADFVDSVYDQMADYTRYFIENDYIHENGLMYNPNYEHSRKGRYWEAYDLITNCFASEAMHKMSLVAEKLGKKSDAELFAKTADDIAEAVHTELISEFEGKKIYTELIAVDEGGAIYRGFSFVNLAPVASDWYAVDEEIMANTYNAYVKIGTEKYSGVDMLAVVVDVNDQDQATYHGNHVIGKGLGWELYYLWKTGNTERLNQVLSFVDKRSNDIYPETWRLDGSLADSGNQEQASWILYEVARITGIYKK